jgi:hypothetical protein
MFVALNPGQLPAARGPHAEQGVRLRRAEEMETLSYRTVVELNAESRLAPQRRVATIIHRPQRAQRLVDKRTSRGHRLLAERAARSERSQRPSRPQPQERGRPPMPDRPSLPEPTSDQGEARFRADLAAYLNSLFLHELGDLLGELAEATRVALM